MCSLVSHTAEGLHLQADPNETDALGRTALMHAAAQGHAEVDLRA